MTPKVIHFATKNAGKIVSARRVLDPIGIEVVQAPIDLPELRSDNLTHIAQEKARHAFVQLRKPCIALDAGFFIHELNGFPRAFVNFALETLGLGGILKLMEGKANRACEFRECVAFLDALAETPRHFEFSIPGVLSEEPRGELRSENWSVLEQVFIPKGYDKTLTEMSSSEFKEWRDVKGENVLLTFGKWYLNQ